MARILTAADKANIAQWVSDAQHITIFSHQSPDGDAVGSSLGLANVLKNMGKAVTVILPDQLPAFYQFLVGVKEILFFHEQETAVLDAIAKSDLRFYLDFNRLDRVGQELSQYLEGYTGNSVMIDHHQQPEEVAKVLFSDTTFTSTSEMIFQLVSQMNWLDRLNLAAMEAIYTGVVTDTGSFRFPVVTHETHEMVAFLLKRGLNHAKIHQEVYDTQNFNRLQLTGYALGQKLVYRPEKKLAYITLSQEELNRFNHQSGDTEGLVNQALSIGGVEMAVFLREADEPGIVRCSFRSKGDKDVNLFARQHWNGGGHKNAAGGRFYGTLQEAIDQLETLTA